MEVHIGGPRRIVVSGGPPTRGWEWLLPGREGAATCASRLNLLPPRTCRVAGRSAVNRQPSSANPRLGEVLPAIVDQRDLTVGRWLPVNREARRLRRVGRQARDRDVIHRLPVAVVDLVGLPFRAETRGQPQPISRVDSRRAGFPRAADTSSRRNPCTTSSRPGRCAARPRRHRRRRRRARPCTWRSAAGVAP